MARKSKAEMLNDDPATEVAEEAAPVAEVKLSPETEALLAQAAEASLEESKKRRQKPIRAGQWPKDPIPNKVAPGYALISDKRGNGIQTIELSLVMISGAATRCMPNDGRERGPILMGSHWGRVLTGELRVLQFTPYPKRRDDGQLHLAKLTPSGDFAPASEGADYIYPNGAGRDLDYEEWNGTFYEKDSVLAQRMLAAAKQEAQG